MNRRQAISRISLFGAASLTAFGGYKYFEWKKKPDISFVVKNRKLLDALAETIIPTTDTPGAADAKVGDFIIVMIQDCTENKTLNKFIDGLKDLQSYSVTNYDKPYEDCSSKNQIAILKHFESKGKKMPGMFGKAQDRYLGKSFFNTLKEYVVEGFCTSQIGATKCLSYVLVPGSYQGCILMEPGQKAWATN